MLRAVTEHEDSYTLEYNGSLSGLGKEYGAVPHAGQEATLYLWGNGERVYYKSPEQAQQEHDKWVAEYHAELQATFERNRASLDERYQGLPEVFRQRLDRFRGNNPDFRWKYEAYELFTCEQAVIIADTLGTSECIKHFHDAKWEEQKAMVGGLDDGHSGNTFGMAVLLARVYLERPEDVAAWHGALAPLVGSEEYGGVPKPEDPA